LIKWGRIHVWADVYQHPQAGIRFDSNLAEEAESEGQLEAAYEKLLMRGPLDVHKKRPFGFWPIRSFQLFFFFKTGKRNKLIKDPNRRHFSHPDIRKICLVD